MMVYNLNKHFKNNIIHNLRNNELDFVNLKILFF